MCAWIKSPRARVLRERTAGRWSSSSVIFLVAPTQTAFLVGTLTGLSQWTCWGDLQSGIKLNRCEPYHPTCWPTDNKRHRWRVRLSRCCCCSKWGDIDNGSCVVIVLRDMPHNYVLLNCVWLTNEACETCEQSGCWPLHCSGGVGNESNATSRWPGNRDHYGESLNACLINLAERGEETENL